MHIAAEVWADKAQCTSSPPPRASRGLTQSGRQVSCVARWPGSQRVEGKGGP